MNSALGNPGGAPVLELIFATLSVKAVKPCAVDYFDHELGKGVRILPAGEVFDFKSSGRGARAWIAISGGVDAHSISAGATIESLLALAPQTVGEIALPVLPKPPHILRAWSRDGRFSRLFSNTYRVSPHSDRVGIRLDGPHIRHNLELPSRPTIVGVVQITREGQPIILGPDGPTIGGYPQAAIILPSERSKLAMMQPLDEVRFELVDKEPYHP